MEAEESTSPTGLEVVESTSPVGPPAKRIRTDKATLLYFGLCFVWVEVELPSAGVSIPLHMVKDRLMQEAISKDMKAFSKGMFGAGYGTKGTSFKRVGETNVWVFQHRAHCRCSSVRYANFASALNIIHTQLLCAPECMQESVSHVALLPFFRDNVSLQRSLHSQCSQRPSSEGLNQKQVVLSLLRQVDAALLHPDSTDDIPECLSTGGAPTNSKGNTFSEDVWSARLCGCLKEFLPERHGKFVTLTCKFGPEFKARQVVHTGVPMDTCQCYPFQGSPDITIGSASILLSTTESTGLEEEQDSGSDVDAVVENMLQQPRQSDTYPSKLGELIANMHICLVKKILRAFVKEGNRSEAEYEGSGVLLHARTGGILCKMAVKLEKARICPFRICVDDFACQVLTPESLCSQLQTLLGCVTH